MLKKNIPSLTANRFFSSLLLTFLLIISASAQDAEVDPEVLAGGEKLFKANCTQCHAINDVVIGPALKNVEERLERDWLIAWIKNSQQVIESGDDYAVALYEEYNKTAMPAYPFSDDEVISILEYVKVESNKAPEVAIAADGGATTGDAATATPVSGYVLAILVVLVVILVLIFVVLVMIVSVLTRYLKGQKLAETDEEVLDQGFDVMAFLRSNTVIGLVIFVFTALVLKTAIDGLFTVGVQQGYQPTQPIAFSHAKHAGEFEIDCNYCHTGVRKSKSANIPSANICMNCHTAIKTDSEEIKKIYAAIDYDPSTGQYGTNTKPIEWVRIHNLPDLAYFNHSQHVEVGGLDCQECHGPIETMEVVYQYSNLTMGWCINCHRETQVNAKDNAYYDKLMELHEEKGSMTVEDIGGLECSKCHY